MPDNVLSLDAFRPRPAQTPFDTGQADLDPGSGALISVLPDGNVLVDLNPQMPKDSYEGGHDDNLAEVLSDGDLGWISTQLLEGAEEDDRSRRQWLRTREEGLKLLGFKLEAPRGDAGSSGAPLEGMSTVRHPLLAEACLRFQANASGELIPADGPVKVKNEGPQTFDLDRMAEAFEDTFNSYLVDIATEWAPDTDRGLFMTGFSGSSFKKVYRCPLRRRPVSELVDAEHLIVSNTATDLANAPRITHLIKMSQSTLRRMQLVGVYRNVDLMTPDATIDSFDAAVGRQQGIDLSVTRPKDQLHTIYEIYCELDLPGFEHTDEDGEETGLALPYRVVIDKTSRQVLEIRRDWREDDPDCRRKETFVEFPFVKTFGFYGTGLLQILGNATAAVTGAWRLLLDAGMFANFPGFLYAKNGARQYNNSFRVPPGGGAPVEIMGQQRLSDAVMPLPYKGPDPALMQLTENIAQTGQRLGGTAEIQVGEGRQDTPVGTTIALIEQAAKVLDAVHKRLHRAQTQEFRLLRECFLEDPEALIRGTRNRYRWNAELILQALNTMELVPRADPNTPSHVHRLMKAGALVQLAANNPGLLDPRKVVIRALTMMKIGDADDLLLPPPGPHQQSPAPDLNAMQAQQNVAVAQMMADNAQARAAKLEGMQQHAQQSAAGQTAAQWQLAKQLASHPLAGAILAGENPGLGVSPAGA